ncbi:unnamed protein product [Lactuca saligna]|uniref:Uncharacterized protein n=1 Tax=Lactuca saligna TaxID=75948 RepID=A0AA35Z683_LACSI|nr:unnamed protein product [Lactuca saligna]
MDFRLRKLEEFQFSELYDDDGDPSKRGPTSPKSSSKIPNSPSKSLKSPPKIPSPSLKSPPKIPTPLESLLKENVPTRDIGKKKDKDITSNESHDAPLSSDFEWDLPISPNGRFLLIFPPMTKFKPKSEPMYEERKMLRISLKMATIYFEINSLHPLEQFLEMESSVEGIEYIEFGITDSPELGIIY